MRIPEAEGSQKLPGLPDDCAGRLGVDIFVDEAEYRRVVAQDFLEFYNAVPDALRIYFCDPEVDWNAEAQNVENYVLGTVDPFIAIQARVRKILERSESPRKFACLADIYQAIRALEAEGDITGEGLLEIANYGLISRGSLIHGKMRPNLNLAALGRYSDDIDADTECLKELGLKHGLEFDMNHENKRRWIGLTPTKIFLSEEALQTMQQLKKDYPAFSQIKGGNMNPALWRVVCDHTNGTSYSMDVLIYNDGEMSLYLAPIDGTHVLRYEHAIGVDPSTVEDVFNQEADRARNNQCTFNRGDFNFLESDED